MSDYFESDDKYIYLKAPRAEFYIPKFFFNDGSKFAEDLGPIIKSLGVFNVTFFNGDKVIKESILNLPTWVDFFVTNTEERDVDIPGLGIIPCKVIHYIKGQKITQSSTIEDSSYVATYLSFILKGKVPANIPYEKTIAIWQKNQDINGTNIGVPSCIEEQILSTAYRWNKDAGVKFAQKIGKDLSMSQFDYIMNNIRQICQYTSTFTSITFEDIDTMITTSLNRTRNKGSEGFSPIEELIKL